MENQTAAFILASSSPQRLRLIGQMGIDAEVMPVDLHEDHSRGETASDLVEILALEKLSLRLAEPAPGLNPDSFILAADTIVALDEHRLGKPENAAQAAEYLSRLSGRTHEVLSSLALYIPGSMNADLGAMERDRIPGFRTVYSAGAHREHFSEEILTVPRAWQGGTVVQATACTHIHIRNISGEEIRRYIQWNEYQGAAGGYRVQGRAGCFLEEMRGSYTNVVGLPIEVLYAILRRTSFWS